MDMTNEELDFTKVHRNMVKYTKLAGKGNGLTGEQFLEFYNAYCELYDLLCEYMNAYNELEETNTKIYEVTNEKELLALKHITKEKYDKGEYDKLKEEYNKLKEKCIYLQGRLDNLEYASNRVVEELNKYRKLYFEEKEKGKNEVTENELKNMIIGMLE